MSKSVAQSIRSTLAKNAPGICVALGLGSLVFATVAAVYKTPKALEAIKEYDESKVEDDEEIEDEEEIEEEDQDETEAETKTLRDRIDRGIEVAKVTWKFYIPSAVATATGIFLVLKSHSMLKNRLAAFSVAYAGLDTAYKLYKKNAVDILGEKKEQEIKDAVAKDRLTQASEVDEGLLNVSNGTLCYDVGSDRYFRSDIESIRRAINNMNKLMMDDGYVGLNDVYYEMGLEPVPFGEELGWRIDDGLIDVSFSSQLKNKKEPCLVVEFYAKPTFGNDCVVF